MKRGHAGRLAWWACVLGLAAMTVTVAALGGWEMQLKGRQPPPVAERLDDRAAATHAASTATVKVLSYTPDTLDQDFSAASALLTGDFLTYYRQFTSQVVAPAARQKRVSTKATIERAGVETLGSDTASILVFVNQTTTSQDQPAPAVTTSAARVGLAKVAGRWLVNRFDPL